MIALAETTTISIWCVLLFWTITSNFLHKTETIYIYSKNTHCTIYLYNDTKQHGLSFATNCFQTHTLLPAKQYRFRQLWSLTFTLHHSRIWLSLVKQATTHMFVNNFFINKTLWSSTASVSKVCSISPWKISAPTNERKTLQVNKSCRLVATVGLSVGPICDLKCDSLTLHSLTTSSDGLTRPPRSFTFNRP